MKKYVVIFLILMFSKSFAQYEFSGGMGLSITNNSTVKNYLNSNFSNGSNDLQTFNSAVNFFIESGYQINETFQIALDYSLMFSTYNSNLGTGIYNFDYQIHRPSLLAYYTLIGEGYKFKFGGGAGLRFGIIEEKIPFANSHEFSSIGPGFILRAQGHTLLSGNFYANVGAELRYDLTGEVENNGNKLYNNSYDEFVTLNTFSAVVNLGISFFF